MNIVGTNQTLVLDTNIDLTGATLTTISYEKPDGTTGSWAASVNDTNLTYKFGASDIDIAGTWMFQAVVTIGTDVFKGEVAMVSFKDAI